MLESRIVRPHESSYPDPLRLKRGEMVRVGERDEDYPQWLWCTNHSGKSGWVPENWLTVEGERAIALRDYDASELTVSSGELIAILLEESGWCWSRRSDGSLGWVPSRNIAPVDPPE